MGFHLSFQTLEMENGLKLNDGIGVQFEDKQRTRKLTEKLGNG